MGLLETDTKRIVTHNPLPATCGPQCPLYDLNTHRCIVSTNPKKANSSCDYKYSTADVEAISNQPEIKKQLLVIFNDGTNLP